MSYLIVGLGNPGNKYSDTRHNIGFMSVDVFAESEGIPWKEKFNAEYATFSFKGEKGYLLKPMTYMNLSGESVQKAAKFFKVEKENILVIHDELDLAYGTVELKNGGGLAGHNGLKSIAELLSTRDFLRLRLGIGRPVHGDVSNFVLSKFGSDESIQLEKYLNSTVEILKTVITDGFSKTAGKYKKKSLIG